MALLLGSLGAHAADYNNPLAAIAANPDLSETADLLQKTGYDEPLGVGGDVTFLVLSNKFFDANKGHERYTLLQFFRDKLPREILLQVFQAMTLDGQYTVAQLGDLVAAEGSGKPLINSVLGPEGPKFRVHRAKDGNNIVLEDERRTGLLLTAENEIATENGTIIIVNATTPIPK